MHKMEQEMEEVFEMKVQEKLQKLKDIEADVSCREGQGAQRRGSNGEKEIQGVMGGHGWSLTMGGGGKGH